MSAYKRLGPAGWKAAAVDRRGGVAIVVGLSLVMPACIPEGLAFVQDDRVEITAPEGNTEIDLPLTLEWAVHDFEITGPGTTSGDSAGYFGIFVDGTPVPPGKGLDWIAHDDRRCANTPGCPDEVYLADRNVFSITDTQLTIEHLPDMETATGHETHEVTIVLLDGTGRRIGESAWYVTFFYQRQGEE